MSLNRRNFISSAGIFALSQLVAGCSSQEENILKVRLLKNSIPSILLNQFRKKVPESNLDFKTEPQLLEIFTQLQNWQQPKTTNQSSFKLPISLPFFNSQQSDTLPNLVSLADSWLVNAITQQLIEPIDISKISQWQKLPQRWQNVVSRNPQGEIDLKAQIWGVPYRWGTTLIAYNQEKISQLKINPPQDWADLWQPQLKQQISLPNQPREVIGLTLKKLGKSYNTKNINEITNLKSELQALHQQVKFYQSTAYLQPLILGDTAIAVGWSSDILSILNRNNKIRAVIPQSGTVLWADVWVRPKGAPQDVKLTEQWIDFCLQPEIATQLSIRTKAASPIFAEFSRSQLPKKLQPETLLIPNSEVFKNSEFLLPLPQETLILYEQLWQEIRLTSRSNSAI